MRISLCNEVIAGLPFAQQCELAAALGYDGLAPAPFTFSEDPTKLTPAEITQLRRAAADAGIAITGLHYLMKAPAELSITTADPAVRAHSIAVMRAMCGLCAELGADSGARLAPISACWSRGDEENSRKRGIECFAAVADAAADAGVTYCIEPLARNQTAFINTVAEAAAIVRQVDKPRCAR